MANQMMLDNFPVLMDPFPHVSLSQPLKLTNLGVVHPANSCLLCTPAMSRERSRDAPDKICIPRHALTTSSHTLYMWNRAAKGSKCRYLRNSGVGSLSEQAGLSQQTTCSAFVAL